MVIMVMINLNQAKLMNEENWVEIETTEMKKNVKKKMRKKLKNRRRRDCWIGNGRNKRRGMQSSKKRKGEKCQGILRKSSQWCNWDMKRTRRVWKKKKKREMRKKEKKG